MFPTIIGEGSLHIFRVHKYCVIYRDDSVDFCFSGLRNDDIVVLFFATRFPFIHQALQNPQSRDILQEPDTSSHTAFIGELSLACFFCQYRFVYFDS